jgi:hypothetical protein
VQVELGMFIAGNGQAASTENEKNKWLNVKITIDRYLQI